MERRDRHLVPHRAWPAAASGTSVRARRTAVVAAARALFRSIVLLAFSVGLCAAEIDASLPRLGVGDDGPPTRTVSANDAAVPAGTIHRARFSLPGQEREPSRGGGAGDAERRRWLPWLIAGGVLLAIATVATADSDASDDDNDVLLPEPGGGADPGAPPVAPPTGGGDVPPADPIPGDVVDDPVVERPSGREKEGIAPEQGLFFSVGSSRDGQRATERSRGVDEDRRFLSLGYDRLLAGDVTAGLAVTLARADAAFERSADARERRSGTALVFADYRLRPSTRLSAYVGAGVANDDNLRFSDGSELQAIDDPSAGGGVGGIEASALRSDATVRDALAGASLGHEIALFERVRTELRLNVDYVRSVFAPYDERGDVFLALSFDERVRESLGARVGIELSRAIGTSRAVFLPQLGLDWIHESRRDPQRVVGTLQQDPALGRVSLTGEPDRGYGSVNVGLTALLRNGLQTFVAYERLFEHDVRESDTFSIGARLELR